MKTGMGYKKVLAPMDFFMIFLLKTVSGFRFLVKRIPNSKGFKSYVAWTSTNVGIASDQR
jgi:hypothetical protein